MLLSRLSDYLAQRGRASLEEIALGIDSEPEALRGMLGLLERKGSVRRVPAEDRCANCTGCAQGRADVYEWCGRSTG